MGTTMMVGIWPPPWRLPIMDSIGGQFCETFIVRHRKPTSGMRSTKWPHSSISAPSPQIKRQTLASKWDLCGCGISTPATSGYKCLIRRRPPTARECRLPINTTIISVVVQTTRCFPRPEQVIPDIPPSLWSMVLDMLTQIIIGGGMVGREVNLHFQSTLKLCSDING